MVMVMTIVSLVWSSIVSVQPSSQWKVACFLFFPRTRMLVLTRVPESRSRAARSRSYSFPPVLRRIALSRL